MGQLDDLLNRATGSNAAEGGTSAAGLLSGMNPLGMAANAASGIAQIGEALQNKFDYGGDYTMQQAQDAGKSKGSAIAGGIASSIPVFGKILGPIANLFGGLIGKKIAENRAQPVLDNRDQRMDNLVAYQKEKMRENRFFGEQMQETADGYN
jgi:hypothetical protein